MYRSPQQQADGSNSTQAGQPRRPTSTSTPGAAADVRPPLQTAAVVKAGRVRARRLGYALLLVATVIEVLGIYLWLRWQADGHPWRGNLSLAIGETLETGLLNFALDRRPRERWGALAPDAPGAAYRKRMQRITGLAGVAEIGIWMLWLAAAHELGEPIAAAGLLVLMHIKHHVESVTVMDLAFRDALLTFRNVFASASEAAGAVACLALIEHGRLELAAAALGAGILIEHVAQLDALHWEMQARDIRLPRDRRWKSPSRRAPMELYLFTHLAWLWWLIQRIEPLERRVNRFAINELIGVIEPRPNRLSTKAPYTSWSSLTDRKWSGRHLPPVPEGARRPATDDLGPPCAEDVAKLFLRSGDMIECPKSTVLFTFFAQWFTDGFLRSKRPSPGEVRDARHSDSTSEIDLVQLYGLTDKQTEQLRGPRGQLKSQWIAGEEYPQYYCSFGEPQKKFDELLTPVGFDDIWPQDKNRLFAMGTDVTNVGVVAFNVLFLREHNRIARRMGAEHPSWDDDRVFETARNTLTVVLLKLVVEEYVNHITPNHFQFRVAPASFADEPWRRSNWMAIEFNLLYRWHSMVPSTLWLKGRPLTIGESLWDTGLLTDIGLGPLMAAASTQAAGRIGLFNTDPFLVKRAELPTIQQARMARLASYNDYRRLCGLLPAARFEEISDDWATVQALYDTYETVEDVEFYPGLFAEQTIPNGLLAPLMLSMVAFDAFSQALTNPLLAPQIYKEETFSPTGWEIIQTTTSLAQIVQRNTPSGAEPHFVSFTRRDYPQA